MHWNCFKPEARPYAPRCVGYVILTIINVIHLNEHEPITCDSSCSIAQMFSKIQRQGHALLSQLSRTDSTLNAWVSGHCCETRHSSLVSSRLMSDFESARVRDYSKNIKTLSAKYYYDQDLFKLFCDLVDRDMGKFATVPTTVLLNSSHHRLSVSMQK